MNDDKICSQELIGIRIAKILMYGCTLSGSTTTRCYGDDGEALWKIKFDNKVLADDVEVPELELKSLNSCIQTLQSVILVKVALNWQSRRG